MISAVCIKTPVGCVNNEPYTDTSGILIFKHNSSVAPVAWRLDDTGASFHLSAMTRPHGFS